MGQILTDLSRRALVEAIVMNQAEYFACYRVWSRAQVHEGPELVWSITNVPFPAFNGIVGAQLSPAQADAEIAAAIARGRQRNVPVFWAVGPGAQPDDLRQRLVTNGFKRQEEAPGMAIDLTTLGKPPALTPGSTIERVCDRDTMQQFGRVLAACFNFPARLAADLADAYAAVGFAEDGLVRHYLARINRQPVATATVIFSAGVAGLYNIGTVPDARRLGIGSAVTLAPLRTAAGLGYRAGVLHASAMGYSMYRRLGFRAYCQIGRFLWKPER